MKAIEVLRMIDSEQPSPETYGVHLNFGSNLNCSEPLEINEFMKKYFLGTGGTILLSDYPRLYECNHLISVYPHIDEDGDLCHYFFNCEDEDELPLFIGKLDNNQLVYIYSLE